MNGYSKMRLVSDNSSSRSMDLSDRTSFPPTHKSNEETNRTCETRRAEVPQNNTNHMDNHEQYSPSELEDEDANGKRSAIAVGVKLSRNSSLSSTSSHSFSRLNRQSSTKTTTTVQSAVTRVLSMRRSSSVSEMYCRIHDQFVLLEPPLDDDDDDDDDVQGTANDNNAMRTRSIKEKKKSGSGRIFKACRRLLGF